MRAAAVAALLALLGPAAAGAAPRSTYEIEATVGPGLATIEGEVRARIVNDTPGPVDSLTLWLYPNVFRDTPAGVSAVNREHYQPAGPGRGGIDLLGATVAGAPATPEPIDVPPAPRGTAWLLRLPAPLPPGDEAAVRLSFRTRVPERLGPLASDGRILTATGGWHPYFTAGDVRLRDDGRRPPDANFVVSVRAPPAFQARVDGEPAGAPVRFAGPFVPLWIRPPGVRPIPTPAGWVWPDRPRPEAGPGCSFPDPAPVPGEWTGDDLAAVLVEIDRWADARGLPESGPLHLYVVPLGSELALATGGGVAVSSRFYSVPPLAAVRRLHDRALARAVLAERLLPWVRTRETPDDMPQVADALGAYLAARFVEETAGHTADVAGLLSLLDFVPSLDAFLRSPKSAFPHVYFLPVAEPIPVRDEPWTFNVTAPRGNLALEKLVDRVGDAAVARAVDAYLAEGARGTFLDAVEAASGTDLRSFWRAWTTRLYREDLRVRRREEVETPMGFRTRLEVERVGDAPPERIEVAVEDDDGARRILEWQAEEGERSRVFEVETPAPVTRLRVDPRQRVTQAAAKPSELSALGDVDPARIQLLLTRVGFAYSVPDRSPYGELEFVLRRRDDVRGRFGLGAAYRRARVGARSYLGYGFGHLVDAARYAYGLSVGLEGDYLRSGFGGAGSRAGYALGPTLGIGFDDRPPVPTADRGDAWSLGLSASLGSSEGGDSVYYGGASAAGLHLEPLGKGHSLALRFRASVLTGSPPIQELLPLGGSDEGIRGFTLEEVLGEQRVVGGIEWRVPLLRALDENLLVGRLRSVGGAVFVEGAWMGDIRAGEGTTPPRNAFFGDAGVGLRFRYDFLGVQPLVLSLDAAVPAGRLAGVDRPPVTLQLRAGQPFSSP